jgi:NTE family protein
MKYKLITLLFIFFNVVLIGQTNKARPKIGLTLSGGGAKGLAHIGILKAIDSAGLQIDYVTGTSMGSIIGAMYASGYSGDSIETMGREMDWDMLLSNSSSLRSIGMQEKEDYSKYAVELPWENHTLRIPSGVLESQELWLKFGEFFFPVHHIKDFSKFPRSFKCIATDVANGDMIVLDSGEIVQAARASMAIPSIFTAVNLNNRKLVDGGLVRNFPVINAKEMGADVVIGSNVSGPLLTKEKIHNIFQILLQIAFFREDEDAKKEEKLCDILIKHPIDDYTMGSFSSSKEIIDEGIKRGRELYPTFKKLADSLNAIYGVQKTETNLLPKQDSVYVSAYEVRGLKKTNPDFFLSRLAFHLNKKYDQFQLSETIRNAFGTNYYNKIVYSLLPLPDKSYKIIFDVEENPFTFMKLGINYNQFTGISLIGNITSHNFLTPYSRSQITVNLGENLRLRAEQIQFFGKLKTLSVTGSTQLETVAINSYNNFEKQGVFNQGYIMGDLNFRYSPTRGLSFGIGSKIENLHYNPKVAAKLEVNGDISFLSNYVFIKANTLSNAVYPKSGNKTEFEFGFVNGQKHELQFTVNGNPIINIDSLGIDFDNYSFLKLNSENYVQISKRVNLLTRLQGGIDFRRQSNIINSFTVGGLTTVYRNQISFAGLNEGTVLTNSVAALQLGLRCQLYSGLYVLGKANLAFYDFIDRDFKPENSKFLSGYSISFCYNFILGPLEISAMYSDQSKQILPYINLGIPF